MSNEELSVVGIGNAIVDVLSHTDEVFLVQENLTKGTMALIEEDQAEALYAKMGPGVEVSGGSVANTIAALSSLGSSAGFIGKVATDQLGDVFSHDMKAMGVVFDTPRLEDGPPTARCLILVTPDGQRTMCTFLGASVWIAPADIKPELIAAAKVVYLEGYLFDRSRAKQAFRQAAEIAHKAGTRVALALSDMFCVERHREEFQDMVLNHVDILFGNESEIKMLYKADSFEDAVYAVQENCELAVLTRSEKGSLIVAPEQRIEIAAEPVPRVIDTTGAGDMYAAGFLHGYTQDKPLEICGRMAAITASEALSHLGARPQICLAELLEEKIGNAA